MQHWKVQHPYSEANIVKLSHGWTPNYCNIIIEALTPQIHTIDVLTRVYTLLSCGDAFRQAIS